MTDSGGIRNEFKGREDNYEEHLPYNYDYKNNGGSIMLHEFILSSNQVLIDLICCDLNKTFKLQFYDD